MTDNSTATLKIINFDMKLHIHCVSSQMIAQYDLRTYMYIAPVAFSCDSWWH